MNNTERQTVFRIIQHDFNNDIRKEIPESENRCIKIYVFDIYGNKQYVGNDSSYIWNVLPSGIYIKYSVLENNEILIDKIIK